MERPGRWGCIAIILYLSFQNKALCQCQKRSNMIKENREFTKLPGIPSSTDLYNSILTTAASNGVLPDLIPKLQGQPIVESLSKCPYPQEMLTKPLSVVPLTSGINAQEPIIFSSQPFKQSASNQNILFATPFGSSYASSNAGVLQPKPLTLQPQNQCNEINAYFYSPITEPISVPDLSSSLLNSRTLSPIQTSSPTNECSGLLEITSNLELPCLVQSALIANDCQQTPVQINEPSSSFPKVSVISVSPPNCPVSLPLPCCPDYSTSFPPIQYPPQPPIVFESSKSSWKKWLPLLLVALLNDGGSNNRGGCSCCCCSCNSGGNNIPVPYPIPIPINNPVINTCSSSRNRENYEGVEEEEDRKRK